MMPSETAFRVTFWGVTGSYPRPMTAADLRSAAARKGETPWTYGGDTTCVQIEAGEQLLIVDAGTGLQRLGHALTARPTAGDKPRGNLFLTHAHLDHVCALPFFEPFHDADCDFSVRAAAKALDALQAISEGGRPLAGVFFPQCLEHMPGLRRCEPIEAGGSVTLGDVLVSAHGLTHPGGSLAYRFDRGGRRVVIATDHEQPETPDTALAEFARDADLLYLDAQYQRAEYEGQIGVMGEPPRARIGWGHTPLEDCLPTALAARARRLLLGHHDPRRDDAALREIAAKVRAWPAPCEVALAYQGLTIEL